MRLPLPGRKIRLPGMPEAFYSDRAALLRRLREPAEVPFIPGGMCARCAVDAPSFEEARAVYVNDGELRELLLSFKYAGALHLAGTFAGMMAEAVRETATGSEGGSACWSRSPCTGSNLSGGIQPGGGTGRAAGEGSLAGPSAVC